MRVDRKPKRKKIVTFKKDHVWTGRNGYVNFENVYVWTEGQNGKKRLRLKGMCVDRKAKKERKGYV